MKFKVGDTVRATEACGDDVPVGSVGTVMEVSYSPRRTYPYDVSFPVYEDGKDFVLMPEAGLELVEDTDRPQPTLVVLWDGVPVPEDYHYKLGSQEFLDWQRGVESALEAVLDGLFDEED